MNTSPPGTTPLRILLVTARFFPHVGGTEVHTYELARRLAAAGHHATVLTTDLDGVLPGEEQMDGFSVRRVAAWPPRQDYYFSPEVYRAVDRGRWDLVHCQGYHTLVAPAAMLAARKNRLPYFVTFHSGGHSSRLRALIRPVQRALLRPLLAQAEALIGVSQWEVDAFQQDLRLPAEKFCLIPNGSSLPQAETDAAGAQREPGLLVSVGRLERYKGHQRLIAALPRVLEEFPAARLRIAGSGPYEPELRRLARSRNVADRVEIQAIPAGGREAMIALLRRAGLVILLSEYESQSISAMEAILLGCPLLVNDSTALSELVERGLARGIAPDSRPDEIAQAILDQLRRPLIPATGKLPTWDDCASKTLALYLQTARRSALCAS